LTSATAATRAALQGAHIAYPHIYTHRGTCHRISQESHTLCCRVIRRFAGDVVRHEKNHSQAQQQLLLCTAVSKAHMLVCSTRSGAHCNNYCYYYYYYYQVAVHYLLLHRAAEVLRSSRYAVRRQRNSGRSSATDAVRYCHPTVSLAAQQVTLYGIKVLHQRALQGQGVSQPPADAQPLQPRGRRLEVGVGSPPRRVVGAGAGASSCTAPQRRSKTWRQATSRTAAAPSVSALRPPNSTRTNPRELTRRPRATNTVVLTRPGPPAPSSPDANARPAPTATHQRRSETQVASFPRLAPGPLRNRGGSPTHPAASAPGVPRQGRPPLAPGGRWPAPGGSCLDGLPAGSHAAAA
jgi:hypothetical protein